MLTSVYKDVLEVISEVAPSLEGGEADELEELREYIAGLLEAKIGSENLSASRKSK